ncbi:MAG: hypothetical protein SGILL_008002 [Bacillariaceae sp.]
MSSVSESLPLLPMCMVVLDAETLHPIQANDIFEAIMGPFFKFQNSDFSSLATSGEDHHHCDTTNSTASTTSSSQTDYDDDVSFESNATSGSSKQSSMSSQDRLLQALKQVAAAATSDDVATKCTPAAVRVRNVEMTTLAGPSGFPIRRYFDWFIRKKPKTDSNGCQLVLLGDACTEQDVQNRERDAELIDFFQNAPIALHWLSGEGKVLWANQTELNVLGYTAEEYIGQDIMKFCPDEKELVLEIFKQLGSGNAIRDVPVRFRTKDGRLVHLLIDSNVKYSQDGSFGHTRCFIRDDTGRKIRQERASLMLEETKRSLQMLDNFLARSLHHLRTPLHVTQNMVDAVSAYFETHTAFSDEESVECKEIVEIAKSQINLSVEFMDDLSDLARFDQGSALHTKPKVIDLESFALEVLNSSMRPTKKGVQAILGIRQDELAQEGPGMVVADPVVLKRILKHLLNNAFDATAEGSVSLLIGYSKAKRLTIAVADTGKGLKMPENAAEGDLPVIFQRYHQEFIPDKTQDLTVSATLREKIDRGILSQKKSGFGIGLSLSYHLVQALGGELRCTSKLDEGTRFQFSLPLNASRNSTIANADKLVALCTARPFPRPISQETISALLQPSPPTTTSPSDQSWSHSTTSSLMGSSFFEDVPTEVIAKPVGYLASEGVKTQDPPSILVVEDTPSCAKILCRILTRFKCATKWVENGQLAVDEIRDSTPGTYDLILMDLRMPVMDGLESCKLIKTELKDKTPVVALSGDDNDNTRAQANAIGFDDFYGKPMKRDDLKKVIKQYTGYSVLEKTAA